MDAKRIAEIISQLANEETAAQVSRDDLTAALAWIREQGQEYAASTEPPTADSVKAIRELISQRDAVQAALASRAEEMSDEDAAKAHAAALAELDGKHDPSRDHVQPDPEAAPVPEPEAAPETEPADEGGDGKTTRRKAPAKRTRQLGDLERGEDGETLTNALEVLARTLVQGGVPGHQAGTQLTTTEQLAKAFVDKARALNSPSAAGRHDVARIEFTYPTERVLDGSNERANTEKIAAATSEQAIVAAGGLCLPLEVRYDIETIGVTDRPVKGALSGFQVARGGLQYRGPFDALAMSAGLGVWSQEDDEAIVVPPPDPDTNEYKTCMVVDCPGLLEASIYSTYLCLEFANMTAKFDEQWVTATTDSANVAWARFAENQLLSRIAAGSKAVSGVHQLGAVRDILLNYDRFIAYYRNRHRLNTDVPLRTIMPQFVINMLMSDLAMQMTNASPAELFAIAQASLESWFGTRGVNVTWHLDGLAGGTQNTVVFVNQFYADLAAGGTVPAYPTSIDAVLYREGDWLFLDGGTLDLGLVRDSQLNMRNRYQTFMETFEGVAFVGKESLRLKLPIVPSGAASGTIDPHAIDDTLPVVTP
jgi:hypothetical protein